MESSDAQPSGSRKGDEKKKKNNDSQTVNFERLESIVSQLANSVSVVSDKVNSLSDKFDKASTSRPAGPAASSSADTDAVPDNALDKTSELSNEDDVDFGDLSDDDNSLEGIDLSFDPCVDEPLVGPDIDKNLAENFDKGLIKPSNWRNMKDTLQKYPRPNNVYTLRTPRVNDELLRRKDVKSKVIYRDSVARNAQNLITNSLSACASMMNGLQAKQLSNKDLYHTLSDLSRMLMASHKKMSQVRRNQIRPLISASYRGICMPQNIDICDNEFLFGHNLGLNAKSVLDTNKVTNQLIDDHSKNGKRGQKPPFFNKTRGYRGKRRDRLLNKNFQAKFVKKD